MPLLIGVIQSEGGGGGFEVDGTHTGLNLKDYYEITNSPAQSGENVVITILATATLRSASVGIPSVRTGVWNAGVNLFIINQTTGARGAGGVAGSGNTGPANEGGPGGTCLLVEYACSIDNSAGRFASGGGGGGGGTGTMAVPLEGGGGAGDVGGLGFNNGGPEIGGNGETGGSGNGGKGGDLGNAGNAGNSGPGGAAGFSVDGESLVTWVDMGVLLGPTNP